MTVLDLYPIWEWKNLIIKFSSLFMACAKSRRKTDVCEIAETCSVYCKSNAMAHGQLLLGGLNIRNFLDRVQCSTEINRVGLKLPKTIKNAV